MKVYSFCGKIIKKIQKFKKEDKMNIKVGDTFRYERTFTEEEVLEFAHLTGDKGRHHMEHDEQGRLMVHGLLTASIGTKIGGEVHYIARELVSEFIRPVFTGDTITCDVTLTSVEQLEGYKKVSIESIYRNQKGKEVLVGSSYGIIRE
ncbi:MaoC [Bacillus pseudomycoides DSM 12442]|nr:MaoC [Bacillus pseudomycoides DSM 12442]